jgi:hypothetical protein
MDISSFPHIFDRILQYADHRGLVKMLSASREVQDRVYCVLVQQHITINCHARTESYPDRAPIPVIKGMEWYRNRTLAERVKATVPHRSSRSFSIFK